MNYNQPTKYKVITTHNKDAKSNIHDILVELAVHYIKNKDK